jgi:hypothetical protein
MLCREVIAVCSEIHTKHENTVCGQNVEVFNAQPGGTYSNHWGVEDNPCENVCDVYGKPIIAEDRENT